MTATDFLRARIIQLAQLRQQDRSVEIRSNVCYSTCTMFLGLPATCVSPDTMFGFHGPSSYGRALEPAMLKTASAIVASHYPPALSTWYMNDARYTINGVQRVSDDNLIAMGVRSC